MNRRMKFWKLSLPGSEKKREMFIEEALDIN